MRGAEYAELTAFAAVAEERSFRRASARLGLTPSALSHAIKTLESRLGARLLHRTTRSVSPTEAGRMLLERLTPAMAEIDRAIRDVGAFQTRPGGRVRLNLPRLAAAIVLMPLIGRFTQAFPAIELELTVDDAFADVVAAGFDAGIRLGDRVARDMISVPLTADMAIAVVGAPSYLARRPKPETPRDLADHACIRYRWSETGALSRWHFEGPDGPLDVEPDGPVTINDTGLIVEAGLAGCGLAYLPETAFAEHLATGRLVRVLEDWCRPVSGLYLYYPGRRHLPAALRAFIDFVKLRPAGSRKRDA